MWIQLGASLATFLTIGGFVMFLFRRQQKQIDASVNEVSCAKQHKAVEDVLSGMEATLAKTLGWLDDPNDGMIARLARIETKLDKVNGGG